MLQFHAKKKALAKHGHKKIKTPIYIRAIKAKVTSRTFCDKANEQLNSVQRMKREWKIGFPGHFFASCGQAAQNKQNMVLNGTLHKPGKHVKVKKKKN